VASPVEWGIAARDRPGEQTSGDRAVVSLIPEGVLIVAIDGLGHGGEAAHAALAAADVVRTSPTPDLVTLLHACHVGLRGTRGAAISLAFLSAADGGLTWLGVGSVEGRVLSGDPSSRRPKGSLPLAAGIPGHHLPEVTTATLPVAPGDVLVLATDGIDVAFADALDTSGSTQDISERILADHGRRPDDALVVAVRYLGERS
jgi:negative regulator of sigma-B (phosphoserine phosphatase)